MTLFIGGFIKSQKKSFTLKSFTQNLVSIESEQKVLQKILSFSYKNWPEKLKTEGRCKVALSKISCPLKCQIVQGKTSYFLIEHFQSCQSLTIWNPVFTLPMRKLMKPLTSSFKRESITGIALSQAECLEGR